MKHYYSIILVLSVLSCVSKKSETPTIITGLDPIKTMIVNLAGPTYDVSSIIPMEGDHHNIQLTPKKALEIEQADLIIALEPYIDGEVLRTGNKNQPYFLLTGELENQSHDADGGHSHDADDEHSQDADAGHSHDADAGHSHDADDEHSQDADAGHSHDADDEHSQDADDEHSHDADGGHSHDADGGHSQDADGGHSQDADAGHSHGADGGHSHDSENAHIWLSFVETAELYDDIEEILSSTFPKDKELFIKNNKLIQAEIAKQFMDITNTIDSQSIAVIQRHHVLDHFSDELGIEILGTIEEHDGAQPSLKKVKDMISKAKNSDKKVILIDDAFLAPSSALLEISEATGSPIIKFNSVTATPGQEGAMEFLTNL